MIVANTKENHWLNPKWQKSFFTEVVNSLPNEAPSVLSNDFINVRIMPWSFVGAIATESGNIYAKSVDTTAKFEPALTAFLSGVSPSVVQVITYSEKNSWLVTQGLSEVKEKPNLKTLKQAALQYAKLQIDTIDHKDKLVATSIPVIQLGQVEYRYEQVLERFSALPTNHPSHISSHERSQMKALTNLVVESENILLSSHIPSTIEHGDLLPKNLLQESGIVNQLKWFDFGDASWNFPFLSLDMIRDARFSFLTDKQIMEVSNAYLSAWKSYYSTPFDLNFLLDESMIQSAIRRAEIRLNIMEQVSADDLGNLASFGKDEFLLLENKIKQRVYREKTL